MKILHVAANLPSKEKPFRQPFISSQINSLVNEGVETGIYEIMGAHSRMYYITAIREIKKIVKEKKYDIIHAHYSYCGLASYFARTGKPVILSLMGSDLMGVTDKKGRVTFRGRIDKSITQFAVNRVNHIVVKSKKMKEELLTKTPISVIPNGVNINFFKPIEISDTRKELGYNDEEFIILFMGNNSDPNKNFNLAKNASEIFKNYVKNGNIQLVNPYGIDQVMVNKYMNIADVLVLTSYYEGSPNVVKEAMACNLPVVSVDVGDVKEIIHETKNCFIVSYSENELAEKLKIIYGNRTRSNGREKIQHLRSDIIAKKIIEVYKSLLN